MWFLSGERKEEQVFVSQPIRLGLGCLASREGCDSVCHTPHLALVFLVPVLHAQDRPPRLGVVVNVDVVGYLELEFPCADAQSASPGRLQSKKKN